MMTCLAVVRRRLFGSLENAASASGVPRSTQQRAEAGESVSLRTRELIERTYCAPLEALQKPFLAEIAD